MTLDSLELLWQSKYNINLVLKFLCIVINKYFCLFNTFFYYLFSLSMGYPVIGNSTVELEIQPPGKTDDFPIISRDIPMVYCIHDTSPLIN